MEIQFNNLAAIHCYRHIETIEVCFKNHGSIEQYYLTMDFCISLAAKNKTNNWLIVINDFSDIDRDRFITLIEKWIDAARSSKLPPHPTFVIVTGSGHYRWFSSELYPRILHKIEHFQRVLFNICMNREEGYYFLKSTLNKNKYLNYMSIN